jgi:RimJ/RimL family protein N-acetyltransferase
MAKKSPYFWIITDRNFNFMGFVYLDNFVGKRNCLFSAELTTCFDKKAWGIFTRYSAKFFLKYCFDKLGLYKVKAQIYPQNFRVKTLLKNSGFIYEATLKNETLRAGKPQDIEVYSLYRDYYYKTR